MVSKGCELAGAALVFRSVYSVEDLQSAFERKLTRMWAAFWTSRIGGQHGAVASASDL